MILLLSTPGDVIYPACQLFKGGHNHVNHIPMQLMLDLSVPVFEAISAYVRLANTTLMYSACSHEAISAYARLGLTHCMRTRVGPPDCSREVYRPMNFLGAAHLENNTILVFLEGSS